MQVDASASFFLPHLMWRGWRSFTLPSELMAEVAGSDGMTHSATLSQFPQVHGLNDW
jgi:hypothetical protein